MKSISWISVIPFLCAFARAEEIVLANFTSPTGPFFHMETLDDPVMGGKSKSSCHRVSSSWLLWEGTVQDVDFLNAPGFCTVQSSGRHKELFSRLKDTKEISFYVLKSNSVYFRPMGVQINNRLKTALRIPITYWAQLQEQQTDDAAVVRLYAEWKDFTAMIYGHNVPAPPLDSEELSTVDRIAMTTYFGHQAGDFSLKILAITATVSTNEW